MSQVTCKHLEVVMIVLLDLTPVFTLQDSVREVLGELGKNPGFSRNLSVILY